MASSGEPFIDQRFPRLRETGGHTVTSPATPDYNCFAFAVGDTKRWWEPLLYWPEGAPADDSVRSFVTMYETLGFERCDDAVLEAGWQKIAIYGLGNEATHAARQLPNGRWTSKLGPDEDIEHDLDGLVGDFYGAVAQIMKRRTDSRSSAL